MGRAIPLATIAVAERDEEAVAVLARDRKAVRIIFGAFVCCGVVQVLLGVESVSLDWKKTR